MTNVFLDLGTHYGQGLEHFMRQFNMDQTWTIHTFEANPITYGIYKTQYHQKTPWVEAHNEAVTVYDGVIELNIETPPGEGDTGQGTSIVDMDKWAPWDGTLRPNFQKVVEVRCIDLSRFIRENFSPSDNIIIKMDIEGAEYDILDKMIENNTLKEYVNFIAVEWHSRFFTNKDEMKQREVDIQKYLSENKIGHASWI
jgi:FkbM family methyltransferase